MSQPMASAREVLDGIKELSGLPEEVKAKIKWAAKIVAQNQGKIWLRTKAGKPMAEAMLASAETLRQRVEGGADPEMVKAAADEVESHAKRIDEESSRRSMVVT